MKLASPIIIGQFCQMLMGIIDSMMVGRLGAVPLAAAAFANGVFMIFMVFGYGISNVLGPILSKARGENRDHDCGEILINGLINFAIIGIILMVVIQIVGFFLGHFGQDPEVVRECLAFFRLCGLSLVPILIFQSYKQFIESAGQSLPPMIMQLFAVGLLIFLNWVLIYGNLGFEPMGLTGAGVATLIARISLCVALIIFVHRKKAYRPWLQSFRWANIKKERFRELMTLGIPSGLQVLFEASAFVFAAIMVGWTGAIPLAAHQIAISIASFTFMYALGLSIAGGLRVSNALGSDGPRRARFIGFVAVKLVALSMLGFAVIIILGREFLSKMFIKDPEVIGLAMKLMVVAGLFQLFDGVQAVGIGLLRGLLDVKVPTLITLVAYGGVCLPLAYVLGFYFNFGAVGIWVGLMVGLMVSAFGLIFRFDRLTKRQA